MSKKVFLIGLMGLFLTIGAFGTVSCGGAEAEKEPVTKPVVEEPTAVKEEKPEPLAIDSSIIKISVEKLFSEFQANAIAADLKYEGKVLEVTGVVGEINSGLLGDYVQLVKGKARINFYLPGGKERTKAIEKVALLSKGQTVTMRGKFSREEGHWYGPDYPLRIQLKDPETIEIK